MIVEFESNDMRDKVLRSSKKLRNNQHNKEFDNVFIRPDRTAAERTELDILIKERDIANEDLKNNKKLDQPSRFVVRGDRLSCLDMHKYVSVNGIIKRAFANWKEACEARKKRNDDNWQRDADQE